MLVAHDLDAIFLTLCFKSVYDAQSGRNSLCLCACNSQALSPPLFFLAVPLAVTTQNLFEFGLSGMQCVEWNL